MESIKLVWRWHRNKHAQSRSPLRLHGFIKSTPLEGRAAPPPWWWCLVGDLYILCGFRFVTRQSDTFYLRYRGVTEWATQACTIPNRYRRPSYRPVTCVDSWIILMWRGLFILARLLESTKRETSNFPLGAAWFTMGKDRQLPLIWMASTAQTTIVTAEFMSSKIHVIQSQ